MTQRLISVALTAALLALGAGLSVQELAGASPARFWIPIAALTPALLTGGLTWITFRRGGDR